MSGAATNGGATIGAAFAGKLGSFSLDIAFEAPMHGVTALFGPSGCGKTTILRCVAGLNRLAGRLHFGDETWQDDTAGAFRKPHKRPIGFVFQEASLFPHLSVRGNLLFGARRDAGSQATYGNGKLGFDDVVDLLGIAPLLERAPLKLSGGERQRVAVGRALLSQPRLLLMDEPLSALDHPTKDEIFPYIEALHETLSIPILYVSHDIGEVARLADRIVLVSNGAKVTEGPVADVLERIDLGPATGRFEAGVVLTARVVGHDHDFQMTRLDHHGQTIVMPMADVAPGNEIRLRVRARDVVLATERPRGISVRNILNGTVSQIVEEKDTAFTEVLVDIGGAGVRARITRAALADLALEPGLPIFVLVKSIAIDRRAVTGLQPQALLAARRPD
jgi:molybdate transport system ATP-binding protein